MYGVPRHPTSGRRRASAGSGNRFAATYFAYGAFNVNLNLTDANTHRVSLYLLDWSNTSRSETITIRDAATQTVLDSQTFSNFNSGSVRLLERKGKRHHRGQIQSQAALH